MTKFNKSLTLISNRQLSDEYFVLRLQGGNEAGNILPGQFVQIRVDNSASTFLRRPISVYNVDKQDNTIDLLIKIAGEGTKTLASLVSGEEVSLLYPLGNSFSLPTEPESVLLVGGGVGVAPLLLAGKVFSEAGMKVEFLLGYRSANQIIDKDLFASFGKVHLTTEDASEGVNGFVTDHPALLSGEYDRILCCGPDLMMKAVASVASRRGIETEFSLENLMACGFGACLCCIEDTIHGNICTCTDGPVFNLKELKWQI